MCVCVGEGGGRKREEPIDSISMTSSDFTLLNAEDIFIPVTKLIESHGSVPHKAFKYIFKF